MDYQMSQATNEMAPNSRQALATATLKAVPTLAYEDVAPKVDTQQNRNTLQPLVEVEAGDDVGDLEASRTPEYYLYHHSYIHNTVDCRDIAQYPTLPAPQVGKSSGNITSTEKGAKTREA